MSLILIDKGVLQMVLNVLRRAGKAEVADELENSANKIRKDTERLDKLELYHREMDEFDKRLHPGKTMWVLFADEGVQGNVRKIIDASIKD